MDLSLTFVGNATVLLRYGDLTVLTDPNFLHRGQHAYLGYGLVSARRHDPAIDVRDVPPLDAVLLSHLHGDHWDRVARRNLDRDLPVLTTPHASKKLRRKGFSRAVGLHTWQRHTLVASTAQVVVTAMPGEHAPVVARRLLPPVMGSVLEFGPVAGPVERRLYISGDTLFVDALGEIPRRHPDLDAGILHLGGTRLPAGGRLPFGLTVTMDGRQGADLVQLLALPKVVPVHFDDYTVFASPLSEFRDEAVRRGFGDRVVYVGRGESVTL